MILVVFLCFYCCCFLDGQSERVDDDDHGLVLEAVDGRSYFDI